MSINENKAIARRWAEEIWGKGDLTVIDQIVAPDYVDHEYVTPPVDPVHQLKEAVARLHATFFDMRITLEDQIAEEDKVVNRVRSQGTYSSDKAGASAAGGGREVTSNGVDTLRIVNGKIVERWNVTDTVGTFQQLGDVPPLRQSRR